jgi:hypothetical protein
MARSQPWTELRKRLCMALKYVIMSKNEQLVAHSYNGIVQSNKKE